jgi:hypothetical protein
MDGCHELTQDLLKLEAIQKELAHYNGGEPTFSQWAEAAGTDENTLRKRLNYGISCKNTMVKSNVRLVISIAREFEGPGMEFSDLIQVFCLPFSTVKYSPSMIMLMTHISFCNFCRKEYRALYEALKSLMLQRVFDSLHTLTGGSNKQYANPF